MEGHGRVERIWIKRFRRGPMDSVPEAELVADRGIIGNANQGGRRQVTVIEQDLAAEERGLSAPDLTPTRYGGRGACRRRQ